MKGGHRVELDNNKMKTVCKIGQGKDCCRYLVVGANGFACIKNNKDIKKLLDDRVKANTMNAVGDNCKGGV